MATGVRLTMGYPPPRTCSPRPARSTLPDGTGPQQVHHILRYITYDTFVLPEQSWHACVRRWQLSSPEFTSWMRSGSRSALQRSLPSVFAESFAASNKLNECTHGPIPVLPSTKSFIDFKSNANVSPPIVIIRSWHDCQNGTWDKEVLSARGFKSL